VAVEQAPPVGAKYHVYFERPASGEGDVARDALALIDQAPAVTQLACEQRAHRAAAGARVRLQLLLRHGRQEGIRVHLAVGVGQSGQCSREGRKVRSWRWIA